MEGLGGAMRKLYSRVWTGREKPESYLGPHQGVDGAPFPRGIRLLPLRLQEKQKRTRDDVSRRLGLEGLGQVGRDNTKNGSAQEPKSKWSSVTLGGEDSRKSNSRLTVSVGRVGTALSDPAQRLLSLVPL